MIGSVTIVRPNALSGPSTRRAATCGGLEARADGAQDGVEPAAQKERSGDREDRDERGMSSVFGQARGVLAGDSCQVRYRRSCG